MKNSFNKNVLIHFREYCQRTGVHGFQYIGEKRRHLIEKIWWLIVFIISLVFCVYLIYETYIKWEGSPVIVNFANKGTPIYDIPFPAVTVCPEAKSSQDKFNFTRVMQKKEDGIPLNRTEENYFEYMSLICNYYPHLNYTNNETFTEEFYEVMDYVKPHFKILDCSFINIEWDDCETYFTPIITDEGVCYTFNLLDRDDIFRDFVSSFRNYHTNPTNESNEWSFQNGYNKDSGLEPFPLRAYLSGAKNGFTFNLLTPKYDLDYACKDSLQGYRVLLHPPLITPRPSQKYFRVPLDQSVMVAVEPVMITTSARIKAYDPEQRRCYFSSERHLKYFKNYTSSHCNLECLTNYTLQMCKCVNFFMPRENGTAICGTGNIDCMKTAEQTMHLVQLSIELEHPADLFNDSTIDCNCLPICADLTYEYETSQIGFEWKNMQRARRRLPQINNMSHLSSLTVFFKMNNFISSERNELYGPLDFLANFGGLLGLFTGFSLLSLMEILYFLSMRIFFNLRIFGRWSGEGQ